MSCAQVFYYFRHYSKKDGLGIKAVVCPDELLPAIQVLTPLGRCFSHMRHGSPGAHRPHGYGPSSSHIPLLRYRTPVYTYLITYYSQPQKLVTLIWYVLVPSAAALFTH